MSIERKPTGIKMHQVEKAQAIDVLERVINRLCDYQMQLCTDDDEYDYAAATAQNSLSRLIAEVEYLRTPLTNTTIDLEHLARMMRSFDDLPMRSRSSVVGYFGTWFSNFDVPQADFLYAAGYALREDDKLLREEDMVVE